MKRTLIIFIALILTQSVSAQILEVTNSTVTYKIGSNTYTVSRDILNVQFKPDTYQWHVDDIAYLRYRAELQGITIPMPMFASDSMIARIEAMDTRIKQLAQQQQALLDEIEKLNRKIMRRRK